MELKETDRVIAFTTNSNCTLPEHIFAMEIEPKIKVLEIINEEATQEGRKVKGSLSELEKVNFILENSAIIRNLPYEYQQKVVRGEPFSIEVSNRKMFTYNIQEKL